MAGASNRSAVYRVPKGLDAPVPILFWEPPEFIGAVSIAEFSMFFHATLIGIAASAFVLVMAGRMNKDGVKKGRSSHVLHAMGIPIDPALNKQMPPVRMPEYVD
ncbi:hypothetical protein BJI67_16220 (plasmid) [Acidihalobacter aeolianus]|uniref:Conjugal transfer protein TraL n=1 Tax=Acidihalobacter aeolianus TaxID=2792603 RepID=A0A1D8KCX6_9GAMM|nr:type IV conjugative transfer system protein TraL [Acidihalobacter aeolianus]AOV18784.1 hypothetical protein BJI67_16220 [Acidihalobacter aeolianus]